MANAYPLYVPLFASLIMLLALCRTFLHSLLEHPFMLLLGESSFALYMIQWPVLGTILYATASDSLLRLVLMATAFFPLIAFSIFVHRHFEQPMRRALRPGARWRPAPALAGAPLPPLAP